MKRYNNAYDSDRTLKGIGHVRCELNEPYNYSGYRPHNKYIIKGDLCSIEESILAFYYARTGQASHSMAHPRDAKN